MTSQRLRLICLIFIPVFILGCRFTVTAPTEGGTVVSSSGTYQCSNSSPCVIDVVDGNFNDTFTATPAGGFVFAGWRDESGYFCRGNTTPCNVDSSLLSIFEDPSLIYDLDADFFLEPVFAPASGSVIGSWGGNWVWTNNAMGTGGTISLSLEDLGGGEVLITLALGGLLGDTFDPPAQSVVGTLANNGAINYQGAIDLLGILGNLTVEMTAAGALTIAIDDVPGDEFGAFFASGNLTDSGGSLRFQLTNSENVRVRGTATVS